MMCNTFLTIDHTIFLCKTITIFTITHTTAVTLQLAQGSGKFQVTDTNKTIHRLNTFTIIATVHIVAVPQVLAELTNVPKQTTPSTAFKVGAICEAVRTVETQVTLHFIADIKVY
jgi:hypothetical protein